MSLKLENSPNKPVVSQFVHPREPFIDIQQVEQQLVSTEMSLVDFCEFVYYGMTNTDLRGMDDPRIELLHRLSQLIVQEGFNEGCQRLAK